MGMSRLATESTSSEPMPGKAKRYSTTTTPPASQARLSAVTCSAGASALGTACRLSTSRSGRPLRRAIITYSLSSTSMVLARRMRVMYGATASVSVSAGRMNMSSCCTIGTLESTFETDGSTLNTWVANSRIRMMPITNSGSAASPRLPIGDRDVELAVSS